LNRYHTEQILHLITLMELE